MSGQSIRGNADFGRWNGPRSGLVLPGTPAFSMLFGLAHGRAPLSGQGFKLPATKTGNPLRGKAYDRLSGSAYYELPIKGQDISTAAITLVGVARVAANQHTMLLSNFTGTDQTNVSLGLPNDSGVTAYSSTPLFSATLGADANRGNQFGFFAAVVTQTSEQVFRRDRRKGVLEASAVTTHAARVIGGSQNLRVGVDRTGAFVGTSDIAHVSAYGAALTAGDINECYLRLREYLARLDVAI